MPPGDLANHETGPRPTKRALVLSIRVSKLPLFELQRKGQEQETFHDPVTAVTDILPEYTKVQYQGRLPGRLGG